jgi:hypothetical protein
MIAPRRILIYALRSPPRGTSQYWYARAGMPSSLPLHQVWEFGAVAPGYLSNAVHGDAGSPICLNSDGCTTDLIYYACVTSGGTCCGPECYQGLQFSLAANGSLTCPLPNLAGLCVGAAGGSGPGLAMAACGPDPGQQWAFNASSGQLRNVGAGTCLQSPLTPPRSYVQVRGALPFVVSLTRSQHARGALVGC